ncbi:tetratricopeptide repeat protein [Riemerella columbina]|uniref:tetratricopeptide repeat protein n=1 Tax=Riemerella columbina TaxID=103810 RepID=UPI002670720A|nr:tetratricopeptide repeat protein [Riemerella columbina]WKS94713.1 tetratricopeptide repeat protein [Riemerella columbina]
MKKNKILLAAAAFWFAGAAGQQSQVFRDKNEYRTQLAQQLFQQKTYAAAHYEYAQQALYQEHLTHAQQKFYGFYTHLMEVLLQYPYAEQGLEAFLAQHPQATALSDAQMPLADYYLLKKDFGKALEVLKTINPAHLSAQEQTQYALKLGYAQFMSGDAEAAVQALETAYQNAEAPEKNDIAYMLGHLYYTQRQNERAFRYFDEIKNSEKYARVLKPYYLQMYYQQGDYNQAISEGQNILREDLTDAYKAEVHKIIGESYFMKGDYSAAYPHLKVYFQTKPEPSETDLYEMGFVAAQLALFEEAVSYYNQLINRDSKLAQNAYYQLGNAYLANGQKQEALSAFRSAQQMSYDAKVKQLAHLQYAKLSYDIGNPYEASPSVIQDYIRKYPKEANELRPLLVKSYLYSGNYQATLEALKQMPQHNQEVDKIEQEAAYLLGTEEFNKGNFKQAEHYFKQSLKFRLNEDFYLKAQYWLAQSYERQGDYPSAIALFETLMKTQTPFDERQQLPYDLGYAYFKTKDFGKAKQMFTLYLKNPKPEFKADAELRLADTHYADNELNEAIAIYNSAETADDYTLFQKAMALGFKGDTEAKISEMKKLIAQHPNSDYADDALYEIGTAYAANEEYAQSNAYFERVMKQSQDARLVADAEIYQAQNAVSAGEEAKAQSMLQHLAEKYQHTAFAEKVAAVAKVYFMNKGDVAGYQNLAQQMGLKVDATELELLNLSTAQQFYAQKQYEKAIPYYEKYLQTPANSGTSYQAQYELGESYYQNGQDEKALAQFNAVASSTNDYREEAQVRAAQILISQNKTPEAVGYLEGLATSNQAKIKSFAQVELMKFYAEQKNWNKAEHYAEQVLANTKNATTVIEQAKVIKARSLMLRGKDQDAKQAYTNLEKSANPEVAAEALYAKAYYQNQAKAFKNSNATIFKLANNYASEEYWGAKALVLMAKNYLALKDKYQASYTCDQIIANYQDFPEVVAEAKAVKKTIK